MGLRITKLSCATVIALALFAASCNGETNPSTSSVTIEPPATTPTSRATPTTAPAALGAAEMIAQYFVIEDTETRAGLGESIARTVATDQLASLLHESVVFPDTEPGRIRVGSPIGFNQSRQIVVRTPEGYDSSRPWPLIVAYHGWGGEADVILDRVENILGSEIENYVVAAPDDYRQTVIDAPPMVSSEHVSMWRRLRQGWNIDSDRTYLAGYSLGGDTVLTLGSMHPGHVAGGLAMAAGASYPTDVDGLLERFLVQLKPIEMLHVYGAEDSSNIVGLNFRPQDITLTQQGELVAGLTDELDLDKYQVVRLEGVGHSDVFPTTDEALVPFSATRSAVPSQFSHSFRYIHQADAFWVEGHEWLGDAWLAEWPEITVESGESHEDALVRTIHSVLGRIDAEIVGQTISVETEHLSDFTIWLHDDMIDWNQPLTLVSNGAVVFEGEVNPSVQVALAQSVRTFDFDRLRLAGIRVDAVTGEAHVVTPTEQFPDIVRGITF